MSRSCPIPTCSNTRARGNAMCTSCWLDIPKPVRDAYWATKPHSDERRAALLEIYRTAIKEQQTHA